MENLRKELEAKFKAEIDSLNEEIAKLKKQVRPENKEPCVSYLID